MPTRCVYPYKRHGPLFQVVFLVSYVIFCRLFRFFSFIAMTLSVFFSAYGFYIVHVLSYVSILVCIHCFIQQLSVYGFIYFLFQGVNLATHLSMQSIPNRKRRVFIQHTIYNVHFLWRPRQLFQSIQRSLQRLQSSGKGHW